MEIVVWRIVKYSQIQPSLEEFSKDEHPVWKHARSIRARGCK